MFILMSIVHEVINKITLNLREKHVSKAPSHAWPNKVHTLQAHAAISCIVAHQKLYHSDLYLLYRSHISMFILMSIVHEVINIANSNLRERCI